MATDMGKLHKRKNIIWPIISEKRCVKMDFKGIHDRFLRDHVFRERMIQHNRDEEVCRKRDHLADEDHTYRISESEYFHYRQKMVDLPEVRKNYRTNEITF